MLCGDRQSTLNVVSASHMTEALALDALRAEAQLHIPPPPFNEKRCEEEKRKQEDVQRTVATP